MNSTHKLTEIITDKKILDNFELQYPAIDIFLVSLVKHIPQSKGIHEMANVIDFDAWMDNKVKNDPDYPVTKFISRHNIHNAVNDMITKSYGDDFEVDYSKFEKLNVYMITSKDWSTITDNELLTDMFVSGCEDDYEIILNNTEFKGLNQDGVKSLKMKLCEELKNLDEAHETRDIDRLLLLSNNEQFNEEHLADTWKYANVSNDLTYNR